MYYEENEDGWDEVFEAIDEAILAIIKDSGVFVGLGGLGRRQMDKLQQYMDTAGDHHLANGIYKQIYSAFREKFIEAQRLSIPFAMSNPYLRRGMEDDGELSAGVIMRFAADDGADTYYKLSHLLLDDALESDETIKRAKRSIQIAEEQLQLALEDNAAWSATPYAVAFSKACGRDESSAP